MCHQCVGSGAADEIGGEEQGCILLAADRSERRRAQRYAIHAEGDGAGGRTATRNSGDSRGHAHGVVERRLGGVHKKRYVYAKGLCVPLRDQIVGIHRPQAGRQIVSRCRLVTERAGEVDHVVAGGDIVKRRGRALRQPVQLRIDVPESGLRLEALTHLILVENGHHAGHGGRRAGSPGDNIVGSVIGEGVAIVSGRAERQIRYVARIVGGHPRSGLPHGFGIELAGAAAAGKQSRRAGFVPGGFRNVRERRAEIRRIRGRPVSARPFHELRSSHAGNLRQVCRKADHLAIGGVRHVALRVATGRAGVARRIEDGDSLGVRLLRDGTPVTQRGLNLAASIAHRDHRRDVEIYGEDDGGNCVRSVNVINGRFGRDGSGPLQVQIAFDLGAVRPRVRAAVEHHLRIVGGQAEARAESANVGDRDIGFAHHGNALSGAVEAGLVERRDVVDSRPVLRRKIVVGARIIVGGDLPDEWLQVEIAEPEEAPDDAGEGLRYRWLDGVGVMRFAIDLESMDRGAQGSRYLAGGTAKRDPVAAARALVHGEALGREPGYYFRVVGGAQSETISSGASH